MGLGVELKDRVSAILLKGAVGQSVQVVEGDGTPWTLENVSVQTGRATLTRDTAIQQVPASRVASLGEPVSR